MLLSFTKMHGLGNDFIVFDAPDAASLPSPALIRKLADRHTGIGFDQALALLPGVDRDFDAYYRIFNADGSEVEQCGNGARCVVSLIAQRMKRPEVHLDSPGGRLHGTLRGDGLVSIDMGIPNFAPEALPFEATREADRYPLRVGEREVQISAVSMGNPHAVLQVPSVKEADVDTLGPAIENHARFPRRTNVGFMELVSPTHLRLRVFERGVGETRACGTGACAAVAVGRRLGLLQEEVNVDLPGGRLIIRWPGAERSLWMTGPATKVFEGSIDLANLTR